MSNNEKSTAHDKRYLSLKSLYLDPNNYRFIDAESYTYVDEDHLIDSHAQRRTSNLILGKNGENVRDLIDSFRKNGFLPVDQIQVQQLGGGKFLVVEGNRRVACLKFLQGRYDREAYDLGNLDPAVFSRVPVVYYIDADEAHHLILMGLKHITGNKKWPAINQAELVRTLNKKHKMIPDDVCKSIGISKREFNATLYTLALIDEYRSSDYGDQFASDKYSLFREVIRSTNIRSWLRWDNSEMKAKEQQNLDRLFSWLSEEEAYDDDTQDDLIGNSHKLEPVITKVTHVRELGKIIDDEQAVANLDTTRNLAEATLASEVLQKNKVKNAISIIGQEVNTIFNMSKHVSDPDRAEINELSGKLSTILDLHKTQDISAGSRSDIMFESVSSHFSKLIVEKYRRLCGLHFENFSKINMFAGINNTGKTSLLEVLQLLSSLNNPRELIHLVRRRAKIPSEQADMNWFVEQLPEGELQAEFDNIPVKLILNLAESETIPDKTYYLNSLEFDIKVGEKQWSSQSHFFEKYPQRTEGTVKSLCPCVFSSPFSILDPELLKKCHSKSLKAGSKDIVVGFIREHIDSGIRNIELDDNNRFTVIHDNISPNPDLTKFGEGLQRIFKIGLLFAGAQNGVVLIDEFENAIHASVLKRLVILVYKLAEKFNVQVFLSSHSKECIDAFVKCKDLPKQALAAYGLVEKQGKVLCAHFSGERLEELVDTINFDLRGGKK